MDYVVIGLLAGMLLLMLVIALLVADGIRLARERHNAVLDAAFCRAIVDAFVGKVERERGK